MKKASELEFFEMIFSEGNNNFKTQFEDFSEKFIVYCVNKNEFPPTEIEEQYENYIDSKKTKEEFFGDLENQIDTYLEQASKWPGVIDPKSHLFGDKSKYSRYMTQFEFYGLGAKGESNIRDLSVSLDAIGLSIFNFVDVFDDVWNLELKTLDSSCYKSSFKEFLGYMAPVLKTFKENTKVLQSKDVKVLFETALKNAYRGHYEHNPYPKLGKKEFSENYIDLVLEPAFKLGPKYLSDIINMEFCKFGHDLQVGAYFAMVKKELRKQRKLKDKTGLFEFMKKSKNEVCIGVMKECADVFENYLFGK